MSSMEAITRMIDFISSGTISPEGTSIFATIPDTICLPMGISMREPT